MNKNLITNEVLLLIFVDKQFNSYKINLISIYMFV